MEKGGEKMGGAKEEAQFSPPAFLVSKAISVHL
jgi:hypothetical protein